MNHRHRLLWCMAFGLGCATSPQPAPAPRPVDPVQNEMRARVVTALACPAEEVYLQSWDDTVVGEGCGRHAHVARSPETRQWNEVTVVEIASGAPIPFNRAMTRPARRSGRDPGTPPDIGRGKFVARVQCVIDVNGYPVGYPRDCRFLKQARPDIDGEVLDAVQGSVYTPVTYRGRPVAVYYTFTFYMVGGP